MKNAVCYSFASNGKVIGEKLKNCNSAGLIIEHFYNAETKGGIRAHLLHDFEKYDALIFISSTGIAVRMIKDYILSKESNPAVAVIDDAGRFVISLLSGHPGGANLLSCTLAAFPGAQSIVTTASDSRNIEACDLFAKRINCTITSLEDAKKITALMLDAVPIGFYSDYAGKDKSSELALEGAEREVIQYPFLVPVKNRMTDCKKIGGLIIVSAKKNNPLKAQCTMSFLPWLHLIPRTLNLGIGLRRGISTSTIRLVCSRTLHSIKRSLHEVNAIASIDLKKDEAGLIRFAKEVGADLYFFTAAEIQTVEECFEKSEFVKRNIGVYNVSAPAASLPGGKLILDKFKDSDVTVSVAEI